MITGEASAGEVLSLLAQEASDLAGELVSVARDEVMHPGGHPPEVVLRQARDLDWVTHRLLAYAVYHERDVGIRWRVIGAILGISRQAACARFSAMKRETVPD
jgi:hypothetical protein